LVRVDGLITFSRPAGALYVKDGEKTIPVINRVSRTGYYDEVIDGQDSHGEGHGCFASTHGRRTFRRMWLNGVLQMLWPDHGIPTRKGPSSNEFDPDLDRSMVTATFPKGTDSRVDSYSCFYDNGRHAGARTRRKYPFLGRSTGLAEYIVAKAEAAGADQIQVDVIGLALHYCTSFTAKDARDETYRGQRWTVRVIADGCKAIGDEQSALDELRDYGCKIIRSGAVVGAAKRMGCSARR
jgi:nicotinamidase/pyrazinamidase